MNLIDERKTSLSFPIAVVVSRFNEHVSEKLLEAAVSRLQALDFSSDLITVVWVPGAFEIPIVAQRLASLERFEAIVALGAVIQGETDHYTYICEQVSRGCQRVALETHIPVLFGVLTAKNEEQALERAGGKEGNRGRDSVDAAIEVVAALRRLPRSIA